MFINFSHFDKKVHKIDSFLHNPFYHTKIIMENCQSSNPAPKVLPQKYLKFMAFIHYYNQHLVDNNISTREELDSLSKLWSPAEEQIPFVDSFLDSNRLKEFKNWQGTKTGKKSKNKKKRKNERRKKN